MIARLLLISAALAFAREAAAQGPGGVLEKRISAATVVVRSYEKRSSRWAPGVLIRRDANTGIVLTTGPCCDRDFRVTVTFNPGTPGEKSVDGDVLASMPLSGRATVRVTDVADLPEPVSFATDFTLPLKETVFVLGLEEAPVKDAPSGPLRWIKAEVNTIRKAPIEGTIAGYDLLGAFTKADGSAPVVDKSGRVLGFVYDSGGGPKEATMFVAPGVPWWNSPIWVELGWTVASVTETKVKVEVTVRLGSPLGLSSGGTLAWIQLSKVQGQKSAPRGADLEWPKAWAGMKEVALKPEENLAKFNVELDRAKADAHGEVAVQFKFTDAKGKSRWSPATSFSVLYKAGEKGVHANLQGIFVPVQEVALPPAEPVAPLDTAGDITESGRLARRSAFVDLRLSPDGAELLALDLCECKLVILDALAMTVKQEFDVGRGAAGMAVTPDWNSVWIVSEEPTLEESGLMIWKGHARRYAWPSLAPDKPIDLDLAPRQVVATDAGILFVNSTNAGYSWLPSRKAHLLNLGLPRQLRLHPSQRAVYSSSQTAMSVSTNPDGIHLEWNSPDPRNAMPGECAISPDGRWVVSACGLAASIEGSAARDFQKKFRFDPCLAFGTGEKSSTFYASTTTGTLRQYEFGDFVLKREVKFGSVLRFMSFDPGRKRLYGVALTATPGTDLKTWRAMAGELVALSLAKK